MSWVFRALRPGIRFLFHSLIEALKAEGGGDILVVVGGIIPPADYEFLYGKGVVGIFGPGTVITDSANKVLNALFEHRK